MHRGLSVDYVQRFDIKGHPINQQSRDYGRRLRAAQNDCLAAAGVVVKKEKLSHANQSNERFDPSAYGTSLTNRLTSFAGFAVQTATLHWVYGMRDRILVFAIEHFTN